MEKINYFLKTKRLFLKKSHSIFKRNRKLVEKIFFRILYRKSQFPPEKEAKLTKEDKILLELLSISNDIEVCIEQLKASHRFIKSFPEEYKKFISRTNWNLYHYQNFVQEIYILRERLLKMLNILLKNFVAKKKISNKIKKIKYDLVRGWEPISSLRGAHIHSERYVPESLKSADLWVNIKKWNLSKNLTKTKNEREIRATKEILFETDKVRRALEKFLKYYFFKELYSFIKIAVSKKTNPR